MILMSDGCSEQRHKPIAQKLIDSTFIAVHGIERQCEEAIQQGMHVFGTKTFGNRGGIGKIAEEYGDLFPFAFEGTPGGQNLLGKVFWGIGQWFSFVVQGWRSSRS